MYPDRPPSERGITRQSSQSTVRFRDPDTATLASQIPSTSPTSVPLPARADRSSNTSFANQQFIINSNTTPALTGSVISRRHGAFRSSATWTSSSGDLASFSDTDEIEDRTRFVLEYNRLAKKHGIRVMVVGDFGGGKSKSVPNIMPEQKGWLSRIWHRASIGQTDSQSRNLRHRRSFSDLAGQIMQPKAEPPKTQSLQSMVTLGGKSLLYLPSEFAPRALVLPTCFRATAQFLVQNGVVTRGVFRISGSLRVVNALYDYYYHVDADEEITQTIRCPNLPLHIKAGVHDVASAFKRFLGSLPGGILGSLALFDALIAIHSQLRGEPELERTRQTKLRARLIAMAIGTIKSQFRRELICAVFGLLSLIGRQAELTPHEDVQGHPLPTSDLMGYSALGIVFGPLLVGNLLDSYTMKVAHPPAGLLLFPLTPTKLKKERAQKVVAGEGPPTVNKIHVANDIAEMLITHWREVVRHLYNLGVLTVKNKNAEDMPVARFFPRSTTSDSLFTGESQCWGVQNFEVPDIRDSPHHSTPTRQSDAKTDAPVESEPALSVKRTRPKAPRSASLNRVSVRQSLNPLSPTAEESVASEDIARSVTSGVSTRLKRLVRSGLCSSEDDTIDRSILVQDQSSGPAFYAPMEQPRSLPTALEDVPAPSGQVGATPDPDLEEAMARTRAASVASIASSVAAQRSRTIQPQPPTPAPSTPTPTSRPIPRKSASRPGGVKAMAAMWEGAAQDSPSASAAIRSNRRLTGTRPGDLVSPYRSNEVPVNKPVDGGDFATGASWDIAKDGFSPKRTMRTNGTGEKASKGTDGQDKENTTAKLEAQQDRWKFTEQASKSLFGQDNQNTTARPEAQQDQMKPVEQASKLPSGQDKENATARPKAQQDQLKPTEQASRPPSNQDKESATARSEAQQVQLKPTEQASKPPSQSATPLDGDTTLERPPSLGTMVPHQEEPPIDKHINFSRPPSAASTNLVAPDGCELLDGALPVPTSSPAQGGGNCLLHAQIRSLQKLLSVRSEEVASLRRQLETMSNMDIGTLSEQLRDAKRECTMWKGRAEAAEKRVAVFEKLTSRIRGIRAAAGPENDGTTSGKRLISVGGESAASVGTAKTEDNDVVAARIRNSLKTLDGTRSLSVASSVSNDGGAGAWWNAAEPRGSRRASIEGMNEGEGEIEERARLVEAAVQKLLVFDDLARMGQRED